MGKFEIAPLIQGHLEKYKDGERDPTIISMSSLGHCGRQLAFRKLGHSGRPLTWRSKMIFHDGDLHHTSIRAMIIEALKSFMPCYKLEDQEKKVFLNNGDYPAIGGHVDGVLVHDANKCEWREENHESMLFEFKSRNDRAFKEFEDGKIDHSYLIQIYSYLYSLNLNKALVLAKNKNNGRLLEHIVELDKEELNKRLEVYKKVMEAKKPEDLPREYEPKKGGWLPWPCGYCPFIRTCWGSEYTLEEKSEFVFKVSTR